MILTIAVTGQSPIATNIVRCLNRLKVLTYQLFFRQTSLCSNRSILSTKFWRGDWTLGSTICKWCQADSSGYPPAVTPRSSDNLFLHSWSILYGYVLSRRTVDASLNTSVGLFDAISQHWHSCMKPLMSSMGFFWNKVLLQKNVPVAPAYWCRLKQHSAIQHFFIVKEVCCIEFDGFWQVFVCDGQTKHVHTEFITTVILDSTQISTCLAPIWPCGVVYLLTYKIESTDMLLPPIKGCFVVN